MFPARLTPALLAFAAFPGQEEELAASLAELSLEELLEIPIQSVYGASKELERTLDAPSAVTVIEAHEIAAQGFRTLAQLLRHVRGFLVTDDRNYEHVGVRGFALPGDFNGRILLLIDGHRVNEPIFGSAPIGLEFPLDLALVERVEIVRGPGSALYGSNAFFAVIDVRTRRNADALELAGTSGSFDERSARATLLRGGLTLSASVFAEDGPRLRYDEFAATPSGGVTERDDERGASVFSRYEAGPWRLEGVFVSRTKGIPTGSYGTLFDHPDNETLDERGWLALGYETRAEERWELRARAAYDHYYYGGTYVYDESGSGGDPEAHNRDRTWAQWWSVEGEFTWLALPRQRLTAGLELRAETRLDQENATGTDVFLDDHRDGRVLGVFVQDVLELGPALTLSTGLRLDDYTTFGATLNPRLALVATHGEGASSKLLLGTAFRPPNAYELYYESAGSQKANPDLEPERIETLEGVHERYSADRRWRGGVSAYFNRIEDLIVLGTDPLDGELVHANVSEARGLGLELELEHTLAGGARLVVSHAWQRTEDVESGERLVNSPEHLTTLRSEWPLFDGAAELGLAAHAMDHRRTLAGETGGFARVDLQLATRTFARGFSCSLGLANVFDREYADPVGSELVQDALEQDGRTWRLTLAWRP